MSEECPICGSSGLEASSGVLWPEVITQWQLSPYRVEYIELQQGLVCAGCGAAVCSMALAKALTGALGVSGSRLHEALGRRTAIRVLEVKTAGSLTRHLAALPGRILVEYSAVDFMKLPLAKGSFGAVMHSDTREHIPDPRVALQETLRVLRPSGSSGYIAPVVVGRLTRRRDGRELSNHGSPSNPEDCLVHTEHEADSWAGPFEVGFSGVAVSAIHWPTVQR